MQCIVRKTIPHIPASGQWARIKVSQAQNSEGMKQLFISVADKQVLYTESVLPINLFHVKVFVALHWNIQAGFIRDLIIKTNVSGDIICFV